MDYAAARGWLWSLQALGVRPGLGRIGAVLSRLGDPQRRYPAVHIAGTNGKGSTAALVAALLRAAGARVGLTTSPHLLRLTERVQLGEAAAGGAGEGDALEGGGLRECTPEELAAALSRVRAAAARAPAQELTFFEALSAAAFLVFAEAGVDVAVVETGLGGRLDATRLCQPVVTVVTSIGWDHMELLGDTLRHIAWEKAGVFRPDVPALVACEDAGALAVLREEAAAVGAPLRVYGAELPPLPAELTAALPLRGAHQRVNGALAVAAAHLAAGRIGLAVGALPLETIQRGLRQARWPGRLERLLSREDGVEVWVDAAHNPDGAEALSGWLAEAGAGRPLVGVFGAVQGKRVERMLRPLRSAQAVMLTIPPTPRGRPPTDLAPLVATAVPAAQVEVWPEVAAALQRALAVAPPGALVLGYGSIFLVAELRRLLLGEPADPEVLQDPAPPAR